MKRSYQILFYIFCLLSPSLYGSDLSLKALAQQAHHAYDQQNQTEYQTTLDKLRNHSLAQKPLSKTVDPQTEQQLIKVISLGMEFNHQYPHDNYECYYGVVRHVTDHKEQRLKPHYKISLKNLFELYEICQERNINLWKIGKSSK